MIEEVPDVHSQVQTLGQLVVELAATARQIIEERDRALEERDRALAEAAARRRVRVQLWALDCARAHVHGPGSVGRYFRAVVRQARVRELLRGLR